MTLSNSPRSRAFAEYVSNRQGVIELLRSAPSNTEQLASSNKRKLANVVHYSCVVLLTSYLERYVEALTVEAIDAINNGTPLLHAVPEMLRVAQVKELLYDLAVILQKDMTKDNILLMIQKSLSLSNDCGWFLDDSQPFGRLTGEPLIGENRFSNPSPEKIDELFRHLGITSLVGRVIGLETKPDRGAVRDKVKEMIDKRNNIAHTGGTVTVTAQDVTAYLLYSRRLVRGMDRLVGQEVQRIIGGAWPWT